MRELLKQLFGRDRALAGECVNDIGLGQAGEARDTEGTPRIEKTGAGQALQYAKNEKQKHPKPERLAPVYARKTTPSSEGLAALLELGTLGWPEPQTAKALLKILASDPLRRTPADPTPGRQRDLPFS